MDTPAIDASAIDVSALDTRRIGFIGIGNMGLPMASRLIAAGHEVIAHDRDPAAARAIAERGAQLAATAAEVASAAELVLASLPRPEAVRAVALGADGVLAGTRRRVFVDLSTTGPRTTREIAAALAGQGVAMADSPVSGGVAGARAGTLAVMLAAPAALRAALAPVLGVFGRVFEIGEAPGLAQTMKLVNNLLSATAIAATSEAVVLGVKAGLDPFVMIDVINAGSGRNTASADKFPRSILNRRFDHGFALGLMAKDVDLCLAEAEAQHFPMWIGAAVKQMWTHALGQGGPDQDFTALIKHIEPWAGVTVGRQGGRDGEA